MRAFNYEALAKKAWDNETTMLVAKIHECKGRQELFLAQKPVELDRLLNIAKIQSTTASNKIEGIVSTKSRIQQLCEEKTMPRNRNEEEISGYRDALATIHENFEYIPINTNHILQLHQILYQHSGRGIGGRFKNVQNYISETRADGTSFVRFTPLAPFETPEAMDALCESYNRAIDDGRVDALLLIPVFITDFLCIHPFNDGNGRMSRLLTTLLLYRSGYVVGKYISLEAKIEKSKDQYYEVLREVSDGWHEGSNDPTPFIKYLLGIVLSAYRDFEERVNMLEPQKSALELVQGAVQKKIGKLTKSEIMELCPTISKSSVENSLRTLVERGEISMYGKGKGVFYAKNM